MAEPIKKTKRNLQLLGINDPGISDSLEPFSHRYPWQVISGLQKLQLIAKLPQSYPADELKSEFERVFEEYAPAEQKGRYHLGGWTGIALHAIEGDPYGVQDFYGKECQKTPALKLAPCMEEIIDALPCVKRTVRLLSLAPGQKIFWHRDLMHSVDSELLRLHIPVITNEKVNMQISHEDCRWKPGELWYGDFTFPHRLQNASDTARVHMVIDLHINDELMAMLPDIFRQQKSSRMRARKHCNFLLKAWTRLFATERTLRAAFEERQAG